MCETFGVVVGLLRPSSSKIKPISPSGKEMPMSTFNFVLGGGELAANIILNYNITLEEHGIYWFNIMLGDKSITKISLNVIYESKPEISTSSSVAQQKNIVN